MGEAVHAAGFFSIQVALAVEPFDLAGESGIEALGVKGGDEVDTRISLYQIVPSGRDIQPQRADNTYSGDENAAERAHEYSAAQS